jgi:hypothetical protein
MWTVSDSALECPAAYQALVAQQVSSGKDSIRSSVQQLVEPGEVGRVRWTLGAGTPRPAGCGVLPWPALLQALRLAKGGAVLAVQAGEQRRDCG